MDLSDLVIVFDLDDTLISEEDYLNSGIKEVENFISKTYKVNFNGKIINAKKKGIKDLWGWSCNQLGLPLEVKESFLWFYRLHKPKLEIIPNVENLISELKTYHANIAILTDGRSVSQRLKINCINLNSVELFISQEFISEKPNLKRFLLIEEKWPKKSYIYIGDNPRKDFIAPKKLGWNTIGADWIENRIHKVKKGDSLSDPEVWTSKPQEIIQLLKDLTYKEK